MRALRTHNKHKHCIIIDSLITKECTVEYSYPECWAFQKRLQRSSGAAWYPVDPPLSEQTQWVLNQKLH